MFYLYVKWRGTLKTDFMDVFLNIWYDMIWWYDILFSIFCHFDILSSIFCHFDILFSIFCHFDILLSIFCHIDILSFDILSVDILRFRYFDFRYSAIRYFAYSIFCELDILRFDILRLRYSAISIFCDFDILSFDILRSIFCFSIFCPEPVQTHIPSRARFNDLTLRSNVKMVVTTDLFVTIKSDNIKKQVSYDIHRALEPYNIIFWPQMY